MVVRPMIVPIAQLSSVSGLVPFIIAIAVTIAVASVAIPIPRIVTPSGIVKHRHLR